MAPDEHADHQPPLHWRDHAWRYLACLVVGVVAWAPVVENQFEDRPDLAVLEIGFGAVCLVLVAWRRRWPMTIAVVTALLTPLTSLGAGAILLATVSAATHRVRWQVVVLGVINLTMTWVYYRVQPVEETEPGWIIAIFSVAFVAAALAWGMFIGSRRELLGTLRQRAEAAEAERDVRALQARTNERSRIAREMHDVLAHRISQISMHAGALTFREDLTADEMRASVAVIQEKAHEALTDLRGVLGVLRDVTDADGTGAATGPQPTYCDMDRLVEEARAAGAVVDYAAASFDEEVPAAVGRTIYRIVQEGITNARKHAPNAAIRIRVSGSPEAGIDVAISNRLGFGPTHTPGAGLGLVGLAERAELAGGWLAHGMERGAFVLRAWLPWAP